MSRSSLKERHWISLMEQDISTDYCVEGRKIKE
jgi:hypothetical protein